VGWGEVGKEVGWDREGSGREGIVVKDGVGTNRGWELVKGEG